MHCSPRDQSLSVNCQKQEIIMIISCQKLLDNSRSGLENDWRSSFQFYTTHMQMHAPTKHRSGRTRDE